ncbi:MAG: GGDEF domain-containing protein [Pseudomonadota bacterium]|nr:GGDEF domain-containing protein [Pseudomonadota bacterium]
MWKRLRRRYAALDSRDKLLMLTGVLGIVLIVPFAVWEMQQGRLVVATVDAVLVVAIMLSLIYGFRQGSFERVGALMAGVASIGMALTVWIAPTINAMWLPGMLMANMLLLNRPWQVLLISGGLLLVALIALQPALSNAQFYSVAASFVLSLLLSYIGALRNFLHQRHLHALALSDPLTGALNRRAFDFEMGDLIRSLQRGEIVCSLAMLDIDHFKAINDQHGHDKGDEVLRATPPMVLASLRGSDHIYRFGGEEFVLLLPGLHGELLRTRLEQVRQRIEQGMHLACSMPAAVTTSIGAVEWQRAMTASDWLVAADAAMYAAKRGGRNRVVIGDGHVAAIDQAD